MVFLLNICFTTSFNISTKCCPRGFKQEKCFVKRFSMIEGKYIMRFVRNVLCCRIRLSNASVYSLFRSKLSLHKGQILILQAGFVHGESRENILY